VPGVLCGFALEVVLEQFPGAIEIIVSDNDPPLWGPAQAGDGRPRRYGHLSIFAPRVEHPDLTVTGGDSCEQNPRIHPSQPCDCSVVLEPVPLSTSQDVHTAIHPARSQSAAIARPRQRRNVSFVRYKSLRLNSTPVIDVDLSVRSPGREPVFMGGHRAAPSTVIRIVLDCAGAFYVTQLTLPLHCQCEAVINPAKALDLGLGGHQFRCSALAPDVDCATESYCHSIPPVDVNDSRRKGVRDIWCFQGSIGDMPGAPT
jgi:hypothetical protein